MRKNFKAKLLFGLLVVDLIVVCLYFNACGYLFKTSTAKFDSYISGAVYEVVYENLSKDDFADVYNVKTDSSGRVTFIGANAYYANYLSSVIASGVLKKLDEYCKSGVEIPIGAFFGFSFFAGVGKKVTLKTITVTNVVCYFDSSIESVGINQVRQSLTLVVSPQITVVTAGRTYKTCENVQMLCYDNLIVGDVPNAYFEVGSASYGGFSA